MALTDRLFSHKTRAQMRYTSTHLGWQWRSLGKGRQLLLLLAVCFIVYAIVGIYRGIQQAGSPVSVDSLFEKMERPMCAIAAKELASAARERAGHVCETTFSRAELLHSYAFNPERDSLVFLHVQRTSGTSFMRFVSALTPADTALWSRDPTVRGAAVCGRHMDHGTLQQCVRQSGSAGTAKRALTITMLRDPLSRFISEWEHVHAGEPWHVSRTHCTCPDCKAVPRCLQDVPLEGEAADTERALMFAAQRMARSRSEQEVEDLKATILFQRWKPQSFDDFITCNGNPAINRQVRMLGNYDVIGHDCDELRSFSPLEIAEKLLDSAKQNLRDMAFFGLYEYQKESQELFQKTFGIRKLGEVTLSQNKQNHASCLQLDESKVEAIRDLNYVDYELYSYAKDLFFQRLKAAGIN